MRYFQPILEPAELVVAQETYRDKLGGFHLDFQLLDGRSARSARGRSRCSPSSLTTPNDLTSVDQAVSFPSSNAAMIPARAAPGKGGSGANACVITEPEDATHSLTRAPSLDAPVVREARIAAWQEQDDGLNADEAERFFNAGAYFELPRLRTDLVPAGTRLGGVPYWVQNPDEAPGSPWQFVGQLDSTYSFLKPPRANVEGIYADPAGWRGRTHWCDGPNFGDAGIAYLFINRQTEPISGWFFWQCG